MNCHGTVNSYITYYYETLRDATDYRVHAKKNGGDSLPHHVLIKRKTDTYIYHTLYISKDSILSTYPRRHRDRREHTKGKVGS